MKVKDLLEKLQNADPDAEVVIASQKNYPVLFTVHNVVGSDDVDTNEHEEGEAPKRVYIAEGSSIGYGRRAIWD